MSTRSDDLRWSPNPPPWSPVEASAPVEVADAPSGAPRSGVEYVAAQLAAPTGTEREGQPGRLPAWLAGWRRPTGTAATPVQVTGQPWAVEEETAGRRRSRIAMRALVGAAAAVVAVAGVRSIVAPPPVVTSASPTATPSAPTQEAGGVAARFVAAYLSSSADPAAQQARTAQLGADLARGVTLPPTTTTGPRIVAQSIPAGVTVPGGDLRGGGTAHVLAQIGTTPTAMAWVSVGVPVGWDGARVVVTGPPAFVPLPAPGPAQSVEAMPDTPGTDASLTEATRAAATTTFKAMGGGDAAALAQLTAPGARLSPIGAGFTLAALDGWAVEGLPEGATDGGTRTGHASVRWTSTAGEITQKYRVTLAPVSAPSGSEWRVSAITAESH